MNEREVVYRQQLEEKKGASSAQLLFKCARLWNTQALDRFRMKVGEARLRNAHLTLFPHIDLDGTRLTDLAARLGVSKQAAGQLVGELEEMGFLTRAPDPSDGRARLVIFSEQGRASMLDGLGLLAEMETDLAGKIGVRKMKHLHDALNALLRELDR